ncbi:GNAT family N-acetyltransferase [Luteibacter aegosomatissinici]|uniref:GNAT family N-acetyltransferase n=1 Tax=Luteibacter aegosomatissinici TaxID=2911539 RepID=UPI001FFBCD38|nr:GNAT family N-acetyltransferase [Luteibacter aegosomatissinici]UPG92465.1 GNAT family N-acetyltransferase [Luteibacter aegosomatissinici]
MTIDTVPYPHDLTDGVVRLRAYRDDDAEALAEAVRESVATAGAWLSWARADYDTATAQDWIRLCKQAWLLGDGFEMIIVDAHTDHFLGGMGVNQRNREHRFANLGYWVRESAQGRGIVTRAGKLALRWAFEVAGVSRMEIVAAHDNLPSRRAAERIGGRFEGMLRNRLVINDNEVDAAMYSVIPADL